MKKNLVKVFIGVLFSLNFVVAEAIPKIQVSITSGETWAIVGLIATLVLVLIYWILQSRITGGD